MVKYIFYFKNVFFQVYVVLTDKYKIKNFMKAMFTLGLLKAGDKNDYILVYIDQEEYNSNISRYFLGMV